MEVDVDSRLIVLVGKPLGQSFAARMQNAAYRAAGLNLRYFYNEDDGSHLPGIIEGIRSMRVFQGAAITHPNKVAVLPLLDGLDPLCEAIGACNTIVRAEDGRLIGFNTDALGFLRAMEEEGIDFHGLRCLCVGAGGAGRAISAALVHGGATRVFVNDVVEDNAVELVERLNGMVRGVAKFMETDDGAAIPEVDLIVNASGVGMGASVGECPLSKRCLRPRQICFDACYNPAETQFLLDARDAGCRTLNGLGMSLYQSVEQIRLWTGIEPPIAVMRAELEAILDGR